MAPAPQTFQVHFDALSKHLKAKKDPPRTEITPENRTGCLTDQAQCKHSHMSVDKCERNKGLDKGLIINTNY